MFSLLEYENLFIYIGSAGASPLVVDPDGDHKLAKSSKNPYSIEEILKGHSRSSSTSQGGKVDEESIDEGQTQTLVENGSDASDNEDNYQN